GARIDLRAAADASLYGLSGYRNTNPSTAGLLRNGEWTVEAGEQGHAGAPWLWSTAGWGVLVDTIGARVRADAGHIVWSGMSRTDAHYFIVTGPPPALFASLRSLSGAAPMFPAWALGFINSQWGIDERQLLHIVRKYRTLGIPLDAYSLDFDWKAWGRDHFGEFRWNTDNFPDGPDGRLKSRLDALGVHLIGIMKPRIHVDTVEGRYASGHDFWFPGRKPEADYFSHKTVQDLNFDRAAVRDWFFNPALRASFAEGIVGWWNDEADTTGDDTQFMNMQRALYDGQRRYFPERRVFSLNRDFYLGAQRYAYAMWSGDIDTGFASMAAQRERMLSAIDDGEMWWGMDGGGFNGNPSPQNYARWIEFDAFSPIFRVHAGHDQRRQPWRFGPRAQVAATAAIRLRYRLMPYIYSYAWQDHVGGIGLVRPLPLAFPREPQLRNDVHAWMFGDWLLVSPVVNENQTRKSIRLPPGTWFDWSTGHRYAGNQEIHIPIDAVGWRDIPMFVREGAIVPTREPEPYAGAQPLRRLDVQMFPSEQASHFDYYADSGDGYTYEHGDYFLQRFDAQRDREGAHVGLESVQGGYRPALSQVLLTVHGIAARTVDASTGVLPHVAGRRALLKRSTGWAAGRDRFGPVTWVLVPAGQARQLRLRAQL
ncbi:MAG: glycoside hydrolase family 31 protein, partial [Gammaproteobacteria bacterium]|nr:glycoside hydrolase family 31 protein [Gammaproteobacteria bacterium]